MAIYRPVHVQVWRDPDFQELSPYAKLIFIYLFTNDAIGESGVYPVSHRTIANDTNIKIEDLVNCISEDLKKMVSYDTKKNVVWVHNFLKYNGRGRPDYILKAIKKDMDNTCTTLWQQFNKTYKSVLKEMDKCST